MPELMPAAGEATGKIKDVIDEILNYRYDNMALESVYYRRQMERLLFLIIVESNATAGKQMHSEKETSYKIRELLLCHIKNPPITTELAAKNFISHCAI